MYQMTKLQIVMGEKKTTVSPYSPATLRPAGDTNTSNNHPHTQISATYALTVDGWHRFSAGTTVNGGGRTGRREDSCSVGGGIPVDLLWGGADRTAGTVLCNRATAGGEEGTPVARSGTETRAARSGTGHEGDAQRRDRADRDGGGRRLTNASQRLGG